MKLLGYFTEVWEKENHRNSVENVWLPGDIITGKIIIHQTCPDLGCCEVLVEFEEPILFNQMMMPHKSIQSTSSHSKYPRSAT